MNLTADLIIKTQEPLNAGTPGAMLGKEFVTPAGQFFIRRHGNIPAVDLATYRLVLDGMVEQPLSISLSDLQSRVATHEITATLACAGNRRAELNTVKPIMSEFHWAFDPISTGVWTGFRLADLLAEAGLQPGAGHVLFDGLDRVEKEGRSFGFGGSIPLVKALQPEVLLAYRLNDEPLTAEHGYPLRVVVPGYIGARSVKWLQHIRVAAQPSDNFFQTRAYKLFPPQVGPDEADWLQQEALAALTVNSVITTPENGAGLPSGKPFLVEGYAIGAENTAVKTVEVSLDAGRTWQTVDLEEAHPAHDRQTPVQTEANHWAWQLWRTTVVLPPGRHSLIVRATDDAGNRQPSELALVWNFKGYMNNAWHHIEINLTA